MRPRALLLAALPTACALAVGAPPAGAAVTIGQLAPGSPPAFCSADSSTDLIQDGITSGVRYSVPVAGTITSWSHNAAAGPGQTLILKVFKKIDPATFQVVGRNGPRPLAPSAINTFPVNIPVQAGDLLGVNSGDSGNSNACLFAATGDSGFLRVGDLAVGASAAFSASSNSRINATALIAPTNTFTLGELRRNKRKGTAIITFSLPNPGELSVRGGGVRPAAVNIPAVPTTQPIRLSIKAKKKKTRKLIETGEVKVSPVFTYTPDGGDSNIKARKLKLRKK